jgi:hypothetical protein
VEPINHIWPSVETSMFSVSGLLEDICHGECKEQSKIQTTIQTTTRRDQRMAPHQVLPKLA